MLYDSLHKLIDSAKEQNEYFENKCKQLQEENTHLKNELKNKNQFIITDGENIKITNWIYSHLKEKHWDKILNKPSDDGGVGGRFYYVFLPTSMGTFGTVKCSCGEEFIFRNE